MIADKRKQKEKEFINLEKILDDQSALRRGKLRDEKLEKVEASLARARALIREAILNPQSTLDLKDSDYVPRGDIYRNAHVFHRSYLLMEKMFKIFVYEEGEPPLYHYGTCKNIYSMEGLFFSFMEQDKRYRTRNPDKAHVYFLPFSVVMILEHLFDPIIRDKAVMERTVGDYVRIISHKYPYWNRSIGVDHFMLSCHDWGPRATWYVKELYYNAIRVLCNANTSEYFNPKKDASFPEINLITGEIVNLTGNALPPSDRSVLAFFAGNLYHGKIRALLFKHWKDKDKDIQIYEKLPEGISYNDMMKKSKFCLCPSGHEVASPRIVEAIYAECVPVLISKNYVLPFSDVLNWDSFSVQVAVDELPNLKKILMGISEDRYLRMLEHVKQVQRHFLVNDPPKRYDVFNMIIHSIWLRRCYYGHNFKHKGKDNNEARVELIPAILELHVGIKAYVVVRITRKWETIFPRGVIPISVDLLFADEKDIFHRFEDMVREGDVYKICHFLVLDAKPSYNCVSSTYDIYFDTSTGLELITDDIDRFSRFWFRLASLDEINQRGEHDPVLTNVVGMLLSITEVIPVQKTSADLTDKKI
ncbi:Exostosin-like protein [Corchorus capsularis]|uniref:Exostosin-like protein n=1 Tax=Corchorus capsularis TaxID=210143 RepID=A0A1R3KA67_COCAP|nr:Exostosin-like protein [Corchorus capsularis]